MKDSAWLRSMIKKHGSEEAVRAFMQENQKKSRVNAKVGGFRYLKKHNPKLLKKIATNGGKQSRKGQYGTVMEDFDETPIPPPKSS